MDETTPDAKIYGYTVLLGTGVGCYCQAGFPVSQVSVAAADLASSVGFMTVSQMLGIALGTGMSGALCVNYVHQGLARVFPGAPAEAISSAASGVSSALLNSADAATRARAIHAIARAIQTAFVPILASGVLSFLASLFMKREKLFS